MTELSDFLNKGRAAQAAVQKIIDEVADDLNDLIAEEMANPEFEASYHDAEARSALYRRMAEWCEQQHITQAQIAERLGVRQSTVSQFENHGDPRLSTLMRYARAIGGWIDIVFVPDPPR